MKKTLWVWITAAIIIFSSAARASENNLCGEAVDTAQGPVVGAVAEVPGLCVYKGIPYAAPPVGELRWRPPRPAPLRENVLVADSFGARCLQHKDNPLIKSDGPQKRGSFRSCSGSTEAVS